MGGAFSLGRIFGIQFRIHYSWFIIFVLITGSLSWQYFPYTYPEWSAPTYWLTGIATSLLFFASVVAHELAHSLVARANDIPVKSITLFLFGGVAHMTREASRHGAELRMALAGPVASLVIGGLFFGLHLLLQSVNEPLAALTFWLARINVVLALFNLIPGFPLDGGRVFRSLLWRFSGNYQRATRIAFEVGRGVGYLFVAGGVILMFLSRENWFNGLWLAFIGIFLTYMATASYRQTQWQAALMGVKVADVMTTTCPVISPYVTISRVVQDYIFVGGHQCFMVTDGGELQGILTLRNIKSVDQKTWDTTAVSDVMTPAERLKVVRRDEEVLSVIEQMEEYGISQMPVESEGRVIGLVTRDDVLRLLYTRSKLGI
ncbi:MAG: site-2 protease family protein [Dehalococcoidia bacterium]|nr:MAG: site-2 protease family protein [Dehalococcoidia bacterium]